MIIRIEKIICKDLIFIYNKISFGWIYVIILYVIGSYIMGLFLKLWIIIWKLNDRVVLGVKIFCYFNVYNDVINLVICVWVFSFLKEGEIWRGGNLEFNEGRVICY